jgi:hypothetical protein
MRRGKIGKSIYFESIRNNCEREHYRICTEKDKRVKKENRDKMMTAFKKERKKVREILFSKSVNISLMVECVFSCPCQSSFCVLRGEGLLFLKSK